MPTSSFYVSENAIAPTNADTIGYQLANTWTDTPDYAERIVLTSISDNNYAIAFANDTGGYDVFDIGAINGFFSHAGMSETGFIIKVRESTYKATFGETSGYTSELIEDGDGWIDPAYG